MHAQVFSIKMETCGCCICYWGCVCRTSTCKWWCVPISRFCDRPIPMHHASHGVKSPRESWNSLPSSVCAALPSAVPHLWVSSRPRGSCEPEAALTQWVFKSHKVTKDERTNAFAVAGQIKVADGRGAPFTRFTTSQWISRIQRLQWILLSLPQPSTCQRVFPHISSSLAKSSAYVHFLCEVDKPR